MKDVFPSTVSTFAYPIQHPLSSGEFKEVFRRYKPVASEISVKKDKIYFKSVEWNEQLMNIFLKAGKDSYWPNMFRPTSVRWKRVVDWLIRCCSVSKDNLCFRYVKKGTRHLYQTTTVPMLIYILPSANNQGPELEDFDLARKENRAFNVEDQYLYNLHILEPNRIYSIPENKYYVILTTQITLFSVHIMLIKTLLPFSLCRDPSQSKDWNNERMKENSMNSMQVMSPSSESINGDDGYSTENIAHSPADLTMPLKSQEYSLEDVIDPIKDLITSPMDNEILMNSFLSIDFADMDSIFSDETCCGNKRAKMDFQDTSLALSPADCPELQIKMI